MENSKITTDINNDDFDPMSESSWTPEEVSSEDYEVIKRNEQIVKDFHTNNPKYRDMLNKHGEIFTVKMRPITDWTTKDAEQYQEWLNEKEKLPKVWYTPGYIIKKPL